jgi:very-short-patch-repair endonuclease
MPDKPRRPTKRAQSLRNNATDCERLLWKELRASRLDGQKFSRQIPVGPYICDFVCRRRMLVIELDGGQHSANADVDAKRSRFIESAGYRVIRFWNHEVMENLDGVLKAIVLALDACPKDPGPPPYPLPAGEGG